MKEQSNLMRTAQALIERSKAGDAEATRLLWAMIDGPIENEETDLVNEYLKSIRALL